MKINQVSQRLLLPMMLLVGACGVLDDSASKKPSRTGLIATPVTYYSTSRARYLGSKYKDNVDRLVERIVRNSKTSALQFANNISSVGGIGFFTHSATKKPDERYLEVVLAVPETFEAKGAHSDKVSRLFTSYGSELLTILSGEIDIYQDNELTGYGLNLAWRNIIAETAGNRVTLERAIVYLSKEKTRNFLRHEIDQNNLLADATIFAVEEDGPLNLVSYRPPEVHQEFRPAIREDDISVASAANPAYALTMESPDHAKTDSLRVKEPPAKVAPPKPPVILEQKPKTSPLRASVKLAPEAQSAAPTAMISAPVEASLVEAMTVEVARAKVEMLPPIVAPSAGTKEVALVVKPIVKSDESARTAVDASKPLIAPQIVSPVPVEVASPTGVAIGPKEKPSPLTTTAAAAESKAIMPVVKPIVKSDKPVRDTANSSKPVVAPQSTLQPPIERAPSEVAAAAPKEVPARPAIQVKPIESGAPGRVFDSPKLLPVPLKPFLPPPVALYVPPPEAPKVERSATPTVIAESIIPVEIASAAPVLTKPMPPQLSGETSWSAPAPQVEVISTLPVIDASPRSVEAAPWPVVEKAPIKPAEQLALLTNKAPEAAQPKPAIARPATPKPLEGFIIQLAFNDKERAQRWAEGMEKKGFAVSLTEAGAEGALRVRLGNFAIRDDAERQLKTFKQEGLHGIILNLPQAFRPEARSSIP